MSMIKEEEDLAFDSKEVATCEEQLGEKIENENINGKRTFNFLLQQIKSFSEVKRRGRHVSEELDYLAEYGLGPSCLLVQPSCFTGEMRDYQLAGVNWMFRLYEYGVNGILADETGCGKTVQTISVLGYLKEIKGRALPHIIVSPESRLDYWMNQIKCFCPILCAVKFLGDPDSGKRLLIPGKYDVCVTSFEMAVKEKTTLCQFAWFYMVIDGAHQIKDEKSVAIKTLSRYNICQRLLITGTSLPLSALMKLFIPGICSFDKTIKEQFQISGEIDQEGSVQQLHKVLKPFVLRRLKSDADKGLPAKKETILKVGMSRMQKRYYKNILEKCVDVVNDDDELEDLWTVTQSLLLTVIRLQKCCNHPYLFKGAEPDPPNNTRDHLIKNAGKMVLLDRLLPKLKECDSRVLIFSQMTSMMDILEDYLMYRGYLYCRIDENTGDEDRDASIEAFNKTGSEKFVFLLSTRAGGLDINLSTADIVILYDCGDGNPHVDLKAQDCAHRIGQTKDVQVFRFCTEYSIEEKVIKRAYKKIALKDSVTQFGSFVLDRAELVDMIRFGAGMVFFSENSTISDEDIWRIIAKGEETTAALNAKMKKFAEVELASNKSKPYQNNRLTRKKKKHVEVEEDSGEEVVPLEAFFPSEEEDDFGW